MAVPALAGIAALVCGGWALLSLWLGRTQEQKARQIAATPPQA